MQKWHREKNSVSREIKILKKKKRKKKLTLTRLAQINKRILNITNFLNKFLIISIYHDIEKYFFNENIVQANKISIILIFVIFMTHKKIRDNYLFCFLFFFF